MPDVNPKIAALGAHNTDAARFRALVTSLPQLVFGCRSNGERTWPGPQWIVYTGLPAQDSLVFGWLDAIHPDDRTATTEAWRHAGQTGRYLMEHRILHAPSGEHRWHQTRAAPLPVAIEGGTEWVGSSVDIDDLRQAQERVAAAELALRQLVEGVPQLLWRSCDMGHWTWASPQWLEYTGQTQEQTHGRGWLDVVHPDDHATAMRAWEDARPHGQLDVEFRVRRVSDGAYVWHRTRSNPVRAADGKIVEWLGTTTDVQDLKDRAHQLEREIERRERVEARLLHAAFHDDLTGLGSRALLMDRTRVALARQNSTAGTRCAVLFLDLDRFKLVNDSLGHQIGDMLLVEVARRLHTCVREHDALARLGGDEFAILIERVENLATVVAIAHRLNDEMRRPIRLGDKEVFSSASIGVVLANHSHLVPEDLLRDADVAMYHAKRHQPGSYAVFTDSMRHNAVAALDLRTDLQQAIRRHEFFVQYQPICDAATLAITGVEALVRWNHPQRGLLLPGAFIAAAEETGLIGALGRWVLLQSCLQMRRWSDRGLALSLSVNASSDELMGARFVEQVRGVLETAGLAPGALQLEITESVFLHQPEVAAERLDDLRAMGVRIALDDFGTGYSSLSYLDRYELNAIKIDQSFVSRMTEEPRTASIVEMVVRLAADMDLAVIAEGVENGDQLEQLRRIGCGSVQGYLVGRPMAPDELEALLASGAGPASPVPLDLGKRRPA